MNMDMTPPFMGQAQRVTVTEMKIPADVQALYEQQIAEEQETGTPAVLQWIKEGPQRLVSWLGNNEIHIGGTMLGTEAGKLTIKTGATQQEVAAMQQPGALTWWQSMPNYVKYGVPALAIFFLLKR